MLNKHNNDYDKDFKKSKWLLGIFGIFAGAGKLLKHQTNKNRRKAEEICNAALLDYNMVVKDFEIASQNTKKTISDVILTKKTIMRNHMRKFLKSYRRLSPQIRLNNSHGLKELQNFIFTKEEFCMLDKSIKAYSSFNDNKLDEKAFNVAILMVQDGTISSLSYNIRELVHAAKVDNEELKKKSIDELKVQSIGLIWQFSTLAFEYTISSVSDYFDSKHAIEKATEFAAELECKKEDVRIRTNQINAINQYAYEHLRILTKLLPLLQIHIECAIEIIKRKDNFLKIGRIKEQKFSQSELEKLALTCSLTAAVKAIIDSPIISKTGEVFDGDRTYFYTVKDMIENPSILINT